MYNNEIIKRALLALEQLGSVCITDEEGRYLYVSKQRLINGGFSPGDLIGKYVRDVFPGTLVDKVLKTGRAYTSQTQMASTPQGRVPSFVNYYPLMENERCIGVFIYTSFFGMESAIDFGRTISQLSKELAIAKQQLKTLNTAARYNSNEIIGQSSAINQLKMEISMVARTSSNVLIEGETGTGKEIVAHSIHNLSKRCHHPFIRVNCSAIPESLVESEFFGYDPGAFTGAKKNGHAGRFERASGGTLFLDEINSLPKSIQPKFLRVLQEGEIERVGGQQIVPIDVRIISACNRPLEDYVLSDDFRQDLYYRLNIVKIKIPPLRERKEDIPLLINQFISQMNNKLNMDVQGVSSEVINMMSEYSWPGNVRELQNVIERAMNYAYEGILMPEHFKFFFTDIVHKPPTYYTPCYPSTPNPPLQEDEPLKIRRMLERCGGNKKKAAQLLGMSRSTLYEKLKKYQILE